jgi:hypothetical protein
MLLTVWTELSGYSFGTFQEREIFDQPLPTTNDTGVSYQIISGKLPGGLRLSGNRIIGTPLEVPRITTSIFCIRARTSSAFADRTFSITIDGADQPVFQDPAGDIEFDNNRMYVVDNTFVDYQIQVTDQDTSTGQRLSYFIASNDGQLPPGLVLTSDGRIVGFVQPVLSLTPEDGTGSYDGSTYDTGGYDFAFRPSNGYDSYIYDTVFYDYSIVDKTPRKINRNYEFVVSVTDGDVTPSTTTETTGATVNITGSVVGDLLTVTSGIGIVAGMTLYSNASGFIPGTKVLAFGSNATTGVGGVGTYKLSAPQVNNIPPLSLLSLSNQSYVTSYIAKRKFRIFLVGSDYFRADNTVWLNDNGMFSADVTYLQKPIWLTPANLGLVRASNYVTIPFTVYDQTDVIINLDEVNTEIVASTYQAQLTDNTPGSNTITVLATGVPTFGKYLTFRGLVEGEYKLYQISGVASLGSNRYRITLVNTSPQPGEATGLTVQIPDAVEFSIGSRCTIPTGMTFDALSGSLHGRVPYQPAITKSFTFTLTASKYGDKGDIAKASRIFTISLLGEIDSVINWVTDSNLGQIYANFISTLSVSATTTVPGAILIYNVTSGKLPPGLTLNLDGEIIGKVNQYYRPDIKQLGLTAFDSGATTFDNATATIDRVFTFTVEARDQYGYSAKSKTFTISIDVLNQKVFSNIRVKPFLKLDQRAAWKDFINNTTVFTPNNIYRPNDDNFGIQSELSMLIYAGIETTQAAKYVGAMGLNHKRKRFQFGSVKKAVAVIPGTRTAVYEIVYVEMVDPLEPAGRRLPNKLTRLGKQTPNITVDSSTIFYQPGFTPKNDANKIAKMAIQSPESVRPEPIITIDSTGYTISDNNPATYFPNSVSNWQDRLTSVGDTERNYLPLWMRSIQPGSRSELGFQLVVPICYCKIGGADDIILNIKFSGFDFKTLDYTADRYIIDSVEGSIQDKYLVFRNDRITV